MGYSNLAYELNYEEQEVVEEATLEKVEPRQKRNFRPIIFAIICSLAACFLISKNVTLYETEQEIKNLQKELTTWQTYTSQRVFELEQSVDLATVEEIATTKLNMQRPESYQIEYVSIDREDVTEITADKVEGVGNKFGNAFKNFKKNVLGIF